MDLKKILQHPYLTALRDGMTTVVPIVLVKWLEKISQHPYIIALRDGMIAVVPIILVGSCFLLIGQQGQVLEDYLGVSQEFLTRYNELVPTLLIPYRLTMGLLALYTAITVANSLAKAYQLAGHGPALTALSALILTGTPQRVVEGIDHPGWLLPMSPLGAEGLFLAILLAFVSVELTVALQKPDLRSLIWLALSGLVTALIVGRTHPTLGWSSFLFFSLFTAVQAFRLAKKAPQKEEDKAPSMIPEAVHLAFSSFLPMLLVVTMVWLVVHWAGFDLHQTLVALAKPIHDWGDTLPSVWATNFLLHLFGVAGMHGISVVNAVMLPIWQQYVVANADAHQVGEALPYITAYPFFQWFVWFGGAGATLAPTLMLCFWPREDYKKIGRLSLVPALFNINEPMLFSLPVVANPILAIPFIVSPLACATTAYLVISWGWVNAPFLEVPWVMPCFLGAYLSTQDFKALLLLGFNFLLSGLIWWPFLLVNAKMGSNKEEKAT